MNIGNRAIIYLLTALIAALIVFVSWESLEEARQQKRATATRQAEAVSNVVADDIARTLSAASDQMRMISRMKVFRETTDFGHLSPLLKGVFERARMVAANLDQMRNILNRMFRDMATKAHFQHDINMAHFRRWLWNLGIFDGYKATVEIVSAAYQREIPGFSLDPISSTPLNFSLTPDPDKLFSEFEQQLSVFAHLVESTFQLTEPVIASQNGAMDLLVATMNDRDRIKSLTVKSLRGKTLFGITEIGDSIDFLGRWVTIAASGIRPFYPGPVFFDEGVGRPLWQAAVPLRDLQRKPYAVLSSQIDLGFLSGIARNADFFRSGNLYILDENGTVIGHRQNSMVFDQVNLSRFNPVVAEVLEGRERSDFINFLGSEYLVSFRNLQSIDHSTLPRWTVLIAVPSSEFLGSWFSQVGGTVLSAAMALLVLWYISDFILDHIED